ncbi:hypothetical protein BVG16_09495 [Paenibacillus selenitireducens]|uniref:N-acetyltransferase domain-containing protein n=1 Tax=Paenibacillus selenitireducens TaxID=1324314 RepID=A0A1T2XHF2_9BACL|nr:GNAT family N-acetyltransferase [Paenibacillus selenitireducens]OPA79311.1 hypothetical protein BVG16_09495 [Paenibacillus selenitireducens]
MLLQKVHARDIRLDHPEFMDQEVQFNLIHRITDSEDAHCIQSEQGNLVFAQTPGHNAWLWLTSDMPDEAKRKVLSSLIKQLEQSPLPGVSGDPATAALFAEMYAERNNVQGRPFMQLESYFCPTLKRPLNVPGSWRQATNQDVDTVAEFLAGFSNRAYGVTVSSASQRPNAEATIAGQNLYLWIVDDAPVSMANIAHRSPRHGRINAVYTPSEARKNGYASAIVAELCAMLRQEGLLPMLYADVNNPDSNKVYRNIGFVESGNILDIKFG